MLRIQHLEEELWFDIKKAKKNFMPSHTKIADGENLVLRSDEKPDRIADYFEKQQWGIDHNREKQVSNSKFYNTTAPVDIGSITIAEVRRILKKNSKTISHQDLTRFPWSFSNGLTMML